MNPSLRNRLLRQRKPAKPKVPYRSQVVGYVVKGELVVTSEDIKRIMSTTASLMFWD